MLQVNIRTLEKNHEPTKTKQKTAPNYGGSDCRQRESERDKLILKYLLCH